jgi:uncharacterized membrane protein YfcA
VDLTGAFWVALLTGLAALCQSLSGFGFSLLVVPPLSIVLGARQAVVVANLLSAFLGLLMAGRLRRAIDWRLGGTLFAGALAGMPVGLAVLLAVDAAVLRVIIAVTVLVSTAVLWRGVRIRRTSRPGDLAAGFVSGVLNTSTSMSGPPVVVYLQGREVPATGFRATLAAYFLASSAVAVALLAAGGEVSGASFGYSVVGAVTILPAWALGSRLARRVDEAQFRRLVMAVLVLSAAVAITTAVV